MPHTNKCNPEENHEMTFGAALNTAGFGLYSYRLIALTGLCIISYACIVYSSTVIAPTSACELNTTAEQQGLLAAGPLIGTIIGGMIWGYLGDRHGRRKVLLYSFLSGAVVNSTASLSLNWIMLMVIQFFSALMASGQYSLSMTLLSESVPKAHRNVVVLVVASIFMLAQGIMSIIVMPIITSDFSIHLPWLNIFWNPWRTAIIVFSMPPLLSLGWLYSMQESPRYYFSKGDHKSALEVLGTIYRINHGKTANRFQVTSLIAAHPEHSISMKGHKKQIKKLFKTPLLKYLVIMTTLSMFLQVAAFMIWLPSTANQFVNIIQTGKGHDWTLCEVISASQSFNLELATRCTLNETALFLVLAVGCMQSGFNIILGFIVDKAGRRNSVVFITVVCGVSGLLVNAVHNAVGSAVLFVVFLLGVVLLGLYTTISIALFPTHLRALAIALTMTGGRLMLFGVVQILKILLVSDCSKGFYIFSSLVIASGLIALLLPDDRYLAKQEYPVEVPLQIEPYTT